MKRIALVFSLSYFVYSFYGERKLHQCRIKIVEISTHFHKQMEFVVTSPSVLMFFSTDYSILFNYENFHEQKTRKLAYGQKLCV